MATKNYMINDKWLDLDKQNIVELQSVDGELDSLKVNGSEIVTPSGKITITENGTDIDIAQYALADVNVEGGGGSSDFSTAEVTLIDTVEMGAPISGPFIVNDELVRKCFSDDGTATVVLYKGSVEVDASAVDAEGGSISVSGNAQQDLFKITITGDCTITIS